MWPTYDCQEWKKKEKRSDIKSARGEVVEPNARGLKKLKIKVKSSLRNKNVRQGSRRLHDDDNIHWGRVFFFIKMKPNLQWFYGWCVVEDDGSYANKEKTEDGSQIAKSPAHKKIKSKSAAAEADAVVVVQAVVR